MMNTSMKGWRSRHDTIGMIFACEGVRWDVSLARSGLFKGSTWGATYVLKDLHRAQQRYLAICIWVAGQTQFHFCDGCVRCSTRHPCI